MKKLKTDKKAQEYFEGWQRARADYENLKRETDARMADISKFTKISIAHELAPIISNFSVALLHVPEDQKSASWVVGLFHIQKQLVDLLESLGFKMTRTLGEHFDPQKHEAVG